MYIYTCIFSTYHPKFGLNWFHTLNDFKVMITVLFSLHMSVKDSWGCKGVNHVKIVVWLHNYIFSFTLQQKRKGGWPKGKKRKKEFGNLNKPKAPITGLVSCFFLIIISCCLCTGTIYIHIRGV